MMKIFRKGQVEDVFSDLAPAAIIIIITLFIISAANATHQEGVEKTLDEVKDEPTRIDLLTFLRTPITEGTPKEYESISVAEFFNLISQHYNKEEFEWLKTSELTGKSILETVECGSLFKQIANDVLGVGEKMEWNLFVYNSQKETVFECKSAHEAGIMIHKEGHTIGKEGEWFQAEMMIPTETPEQILTVEVKFFK